MNNLSLIERLKTLEQKCRGNLDHIDLNTLMEYRAALRNAAPALIACVEALRLRFEWDEAFNSSAAASDAVLKAHGWDGKSSPDEFMEKKAREALRRLEEVK